MPSLNISLRALGRRKPLVPDWQLPPEDDAGEPLTLRALLTRIVRREVQAFRERQEARRVVRLLSVREIEQGLARGKVEAGGSDLQQEVDEEEAVGTALQAFEDGLYLVILDEVEQRDLEAEVHYREDSQLVFIRLVMLAGG